MTSSIVSLGDILKKVDSRTTDTLAKNPPVIDIDDLDEFTSADIRSAQATTWSRLDDAVVVVADLKGSTKLSIGKHMASTAAIYEAATGNATRILAEFGADFVAIQGDGTFGVFWGERALERAMCAGITIKTFSLKTLVPKLRAKWPDTGLPETGFKVGIAAGRVMVKNLGLGLDAGQHEPIWAGNPVNYATKAAQEADVDELIVTGGVWARIEENDYLTLSCPCDGGPSPTIWAERELVKLAHDEPEAAGHILSSAWCDEHGSTFCTSILAGETSREEERIDAARAEKRRRWDTVAMQRRARTRARKYGLANVR